MARLWVGGFGRNWQVKGKFRDKLATSRDQGIERVEARPKKECSDFALFSFVFDHRDLNLWLDEATSIRGTRADYFRTLGSVREEPAHICLQDGNWV
jgi:hypothetical protein